VCGVVVETHSEGCKIPACSLHASDIYTAGPGLFLLPSIQSQARIFSCNMTRTKDLAFAVSYYKRRAQHRWSRSDEVWGRIPDEAPLESTPEYSRPSPHLCQAVPQLAQH
jgi:hypothetical protein